MDQGMVSGGVRKLHTFLSLAHLDPPSSRAQSNQWVSIKCPRRFGESCAEVAQQAVQSSSSACVKHQIGNPYDLGLLHHNEKAQ